METSAAVSLMVIYEDESVDVRRGDGAQFQLSPCGCEFTLLKPCDPSGHPLQPNRRVRQRTRFTISTYKESMVAALAFRNKYACRPYLPEELIPSENKKPFFSIDCVVQWPDGSPHVGDLGPGGETVVRSENGRAALMLSPSGQDFCVEFTCGLSRARGQQSGQVSDLTCQTSSDKAKEVHQGRGSSTNETSGSRSRSCSPCVDTAHPKPEEMYQSITVVQHHSCCAVDPVWSYPLSLAHRLQAARLSEPVHVPSEGHGDLGRTHRKINMSDMSTAERRSRLPQALPLTCPSPHRHRWNVEDPLTKINQTHHDLPTGLVKVMWCQGVTYRILSGAVSVVEVSPGDGSVLRSNGVLNTYFIHHKPELLSGQVKEVTYHLKNLPPDVPGQLYSICSIVSRASRLLACYEEARQSLNHPATHSCLQEGSCLSSPATVDENLSNRAYDEQHVHVPLAVESRSDLVAAELEKIKRFNFLLENSRLPRSDKGRMELEGSSAEEVTGEEVNEDCIAEALQRTSKAIQDIDALISSATIT